MSMRYVVEQVVKQLAMRRIKDTERVRYVKQPHGSDLWLAEAAKTKAAELNGAHQVAH